MIASGIVVPFLQTAGTWSVQFGPWNLPPQAWMPATALIGALALRTRARALAGRAASPSTDSSEEA
ncbi:MAG: hypothetical protein R3195_05095 [Gemmatimonadota bacterium]|nr:hypothetical protein [Gemmatimonadota bacterium]